MLQGVENSMEQCCKLGERMLQITRANRYEVQ